VGVDHVSPLLLDQATEKKRELPTVAAAALVCGLVDAEPVRVEEANGT